MSRQDLDDLVRLGICTAILLVGVLMTVSGPEPEPLKQPTGEFKKAVEYQQAPGLPGRGLFEGKRLR